jgi:hypothetical protein
MTEASSNDGYKGTARAIAVGLADLLAEMGLTAVLDPGHEGIIDPVVHFVDKDGRPNAVEVDLGGVREGIGGAHVMLADFAVFPLGDSGWTVGYALHSSIATGSSVYTDEQTLEALRHLLRRHAGDFGVADSAQARTTTDRRLVSAYKKLAAVAAHVPGERSIEIRMEEDGGTVVARLNLADAWIDVRLPDGMAVIAASNGSQIAAEKRKVVEMAIDDLVAELDAAPMPTPR